MSKKQKWDPSKGWRSAPKDILPDDLKNLFEELEKDYQSWVNTPQFVVDKKKYESSIDGELRKLFADLHEDEKSSIWWYTRARPQFGFNGKTPYEYVIDNKESGLNYVKYVVNSMIWGNCA